MADDAVARKLGFSSYGELESFVEQTRSPSGLAQPTLATPMTTRGPKRRIKTRLPSSTAPPNLNPDSHHLLKPYKAPPVHTLPDTTPSHPSSLVNLPQTPAPHPSKFTYLGKTPESQYLAYPMLRHNCKRLVQDVKAVQDWIEHVALPWITKHQRKFRQMDSIPPPPSFMTETDLQSLLPLPLHSIKPTDHTELDEIYATGLEYRAVLREKSRELQAWKGEVAAVYKLLSNKKRSVTKSNKTGLVPSDTLIRITVDDYRRDVASSDVESDVVAQTKDALSDADEGSGLEDKEKTPTPKQTDHHEGRRVNGISFAKEKGKKALYGKEDVYHAGQAEDHEWAKAPGNRDVNLDKAVKWEETQSNVEKDDKHASIRHKTLKVITSSQEPPTQTQLSTRLWSTPEKPKKLVVTPVNSPLLERIISPAEQKLNMGLKQPSSDAANSLDSMLSPGDVQYTRKRYREEVENVYTTVLKGSRKTNSNIAKGEPHQQDEDITNSMIIENARSKRRMEAENIRKGRSSSGQHPLREKYEEVVRNKEQRRYMVAEACPECEAFYKREALATGADLQSLLRQSCRHRRRFEADPEPVDYWKLGFPSTPVVDRINRQAKELRQSKRRPGK